METEEGGCVIQILNNQFSTVGTAEIVLSFLYNNKFSDVGSFVAELPNTQNYNISDGTFLKFNDEYFIVRYISYNGERYTFKGYDLKGLLRQRVVHPKTWKGTPEQIIKTIVTENTGGSRNFPLFNVAEISDTTSEEQEYILDKALKLDEAVNELCELYNIGYTVKYNGTNIVFDIVEPVERNIKYSNTNGDYSSFDYTYDSLTETNVVYNRAEPVGMEVTIDVTSSSLKADGLRRSGNIYVDKGTVYFESGASYTNEEKEQVDTWDTNNGNRYVYAYHNKGNGGKGIGIYDVTPSVQGYEYTFLAKINVTNALVEPYELQPYFGDYYITEEAHTGFARREAIGDYTNGVEEIQNKSNASLKENAVSESFNTELIPNTDYKTKWFLGDIISFEIRNSATAITQTAQVADVQEAWENGCYKVLPIIGKERKNIFKQLLKG